jgi:hypothetical protein
MGLENKRWQCTDCDYTTEHPSLAENHRNAHNHKLSVRYDEDEAHD